MNDKTTTIFGEITMKLITNIKNCEDSFIQLIRHRLGLVIHDHQKKELHKTILDACKRFDCLPEAYLKLLTTCSHDSPLLEHLIAGVTIGETYFFRDKNQMRLLQDSVLPAIIKTKRGNGDLAIRIWSAGCASGEEIYTIAMLLYEMLPDLEAWTLHLLGTDINTAVLQKAKLGFYSEWSMRSITDYFKRRYFVEESHKYSINEKIRDVVTFSYLNLNDMTYPSIFNGTNAQDLILCRNVLIYFDNEHVVNLMRKFNASLVEGGYLLLGASDPINIKGTDLVFHYREGTLFSRPTEEQKNEIIIPPSVKLAARKTPKIHVRNKPIARESTSHASKPIQAVNPALIEKLFAESRWQEALDVINANEKKSSYLLSASATALANLGKLTLAVNCCQKSLALDSTDKQTYFTLAMILIELNRLSEAEAALRKTLYLDHNFVIGHFQLGLLLLKNKQYDPGLKCLRNALEIVRTQDPSQPVAGFQELNYGRLTEILANEIELNIASRS